MNTIYSTRSEALDVIVRILDDFAEQYNLDAIADEAITAELSAQGWLEGYRIVDEDTFWAICEQHESN